jgi:hypothetical protein
MYTYPELATFVFLSSVSVSFIGLLFEQHTYVDLQRKTFSETLLLTLSYNDWKAASKNLPFGGRLGAV